MEKQLAAGGRASREVYPGIGHADLVVQFSKLHRNNAAVIGDVTDFINQTQAEPVQEPKKEEAIHGT